MAQGARRSRGSGFALVEVIVALAVILILAAVALPQVTGYLDQKKAEAAATQLAGVRDALFNPATTTDFFNVVGNNASRLSQLTTPLVAGDVDACGNTFSGGERGNWPNGGPWLNYGIDATVGMATPIGQADNVMTRAPAGGGAGINTLRINFTNAVRLDDALNLDLLVDGVSGWNAGTVQWTPQAGTNGIVTLYYYITINSTC